MAEKIAARCEDILGFRPEVIRPIASNEKDTHYMNYSINKIKATGFKLIGSMDDEIDSTLKLCQQSFVSNEFYLEK